VGAHEWRKKGVEVPALGGPGHNRIHPHYGVFSPVRGEYVQLVAQAPLPAKTLAFDIGVGTGVLSAVLAHRGVLRVVATDQDSRALACARDNLQRLGLKDRRSKSSRPTFFRAQAHVWPGAADRLQPALGAGARQLARSSTRSTTPTAACCAAFWSGWPRT
jgi:SAM-dependent methyltransferase